MVDKTTAEKEQFSLRFNFGKISDRRSYPFSEANRWTAFRQKIRVLFSALSRKNNALLSARFSLFYRIDARYAKDTSPSVITKSYLDSIFRISKPYLLKTLKKEDYDSLKKKTEFLRESNQKDIINKFSKIYRNIVKQRHQSEYTRADIKLDKFINDRAGKAKIIWGDCLKALQAIKSESVHLMVTSPPYYNAREYSQWKNLDEYLNDMSEIVKESYRVIDNHRAFVFNVGDITGNDNLETLSAWGARRIPLGAYFISIFEKAGFKFIDDFIWDKGQVESQRHKNGDTPHPMYQYPMNCYEHIMIFLKHRKDETLYPCPVCGCLKVNGNAYSGVGIRSWECKNLQCFERSASNRGKRFSLRSIVMEELKTNIIDADFVKKWRRDIIKINPIIKINSKGENTLGHTAPFPSEIPEFAIKMLSGKGEVVLDPFAGSFTSAIEAVKLGRIGVGIELNKKFFKKAILQNIKKHKLSCGEYQC